jgi:thiosulfate/3-mercaptopyruvate sulfurtransferase
LYDPNTRLLEVGWDTSEYESGHIPGAVANWGLSDLQQHLADKAQVEAMLSEAGIANNSTLVIYGGLSNLVAVMVFWMLRIYGHAEVRLLDGGRQKWVAEGRPLSSEKPAIQPARYVAQTPDWSLRADKDQVIRAIGQPGHVIVDARPVDMYSGENSAGMKRSGHIPSAINIPAKWVTNADGSLQGWQTPTTRSDGTFKSVEELKALFSANGLTPEQKIITYCVRGGLSTHMWFTLTQLLGYPNVHEYDRSWVEWGNREDTPIE